MSILKINNDKYDECISACAKCIQACYECLQMCLNEDDVEKRRDCISMLLECSKICELAVSYMTIDAKHVHNVCELCSTICDECSSHCSMFNDEHCKKCAEICSECSKICNNMIR